MTGISTTGAGSMSVFCQISGRDISPESCSQTQGQEGCFGCAAYTRRCESCLTNFVAVAATGTCSSCTATEFKREADLQLLPIPKTVTCQMIKRQISGSMCQSLQGQDGCRGCTAVSRACEHCGTRPVRFPQYGMCFTCSVKELGDDWQLEEADRSVMYPHLHVVSDSDDASAESVQEILPFAQDFRRIPLANIREPEQRVRQKYDKQELFDLGNSMMHDGMIYPVIVEMVSENFYEIIIGSRRVRAARIREMTDIPALVVGPQSPLTRIIMALAENIHRVNLDPFEEAKVFLRLMKEYDIDTNEVAQKVRRSPHYVRERIQLLSLPEDVQQLVSDGELSLGNAIVLARLPEKERQKKLAQASLTHRFAPNELRRKIAGEISEMEKPGRVIPYRVTPEKFTARTEEFVRWFKRATPQLVLDGSTLDERVMMMNALASLENQIGKMKDVIKKGKSVSKRRAKK